MDDGTLVADRFTVERLVSAGGMGYVYRAVDALTGQPVALKVVQRRDASSTTRFLREGRVLSTLHHSRIVRYIAHGVTGAGEAYVVMEWLDGEDLAKHLRASELSLRQSVSIIVQACEGLAVAHSKGLVHRDLKPSNLFLVGGDLGALKVIDFGVVRLNDESTELTQTGMLLGTPGYMAPEQLGSSKELDARADVFALGCVLYRCLTGVGPFASPERVAALTRTLFEEPVPPRATRPEVPEALEELVLRMLRKKPEDRPKDAAAVLRALHGIDLPSSQRLPGARLRRDALTDSEQRVVSLVLMGPSAVRLARTGGALPAVTEAELRPRVEAVGARLEALGGGAFAAIAALTGTPADKAAQAARAALAIRDVVPDAPIAVATGLGDTSSQRPVGEVIERAAVLLRGPVPQASTSNETLPVDAPAALEPDAPQERRPIYVDDVTAMLLNRRFDIETDGDLRVLARENAAIEPVRTLLGKPTPCIGRERELSMLAAIFEECVTEPIASAVIVTAPAGVGKSRLRYEFLRQLEGRAERVEVWTGRADPMSAGAPFGILAQALRATAGLTEDDPLPVRREKLEARVLRHTPTEDAPRVIDFLGELVGVPFPDDASPQLHAARLDPILMGGQMRRAWEDFVVAECRAHPLVLVLEDLHWGDLPTVRFVDAALRVREQPLLVLAFARPEVDDLFPKLWSERRVQPLPLSELSPRSTERLVRKVLGDGAHPDVVKRIVDRAQGNAFHVEELIRAVVEGRGDALPETVLAMTQTRLEALEVEARRVLRAASVFGQSFWIDGVTALLGGEATVVPVAARLDTLAEREFLARRSSSRLAAQVELTFRHAFVRDAVYATLTPADRALGHRLAGGWLLSHGETEPLVLAQHFDLGEERESAAHWYAKAAEGALEGNDFVAACERAGRGRVCGASGVALGRLYALEMESFYWRGELGDGARAGAFALDLLEAGSEDYFRAIARLITIHGRAGAVPDVERLVEQLASEVEGGRARPEAARLCACALAEAVSQLFYFGHSEAVERIVSLAERTYGASTDPAVAAWVLELHATQALSRGDMAEGLELTEKVAEAFAAHGDLRQACVEQSYVSYSYMEMGLDAESERHAREALALAESMGLSWVIDALNHNLGYALVRLGRLEEAERVERDAVDGTKRHGHRRLECDSKLYLALIRLARGDAEDAERTARSCVEMAEPGSPWGARALAGLASVHLAQGRVVEALDEATRAFRTLEKVGGVVDSLGGLVHLVYARTTFESGDRQTAKTVVQKACEALDLAAAKIKRPEWRKSYLENIPEHRRLRELAVEWATAT